jgi:hypothetical protein
MGLAGRLTVTISAGIVVAGALSGLIAAFIYFHQGLADPGTLPCGGTAVFHGKGVRTDDIPPTLPAKIRCGSCSVCTTDRKR